jgi:hypothetical protein
MFGLEAKAMVWMNAYYKIKQMKLVLLPLVQML